MQIAAPQAMPLAVVRLRAGMSGWEVIGPTGKGNRRAKPPSAHLAIWRSLPVRRMTIFGRMTASGHCPEAVMPEFESPRWSSACAPNAIDRTAKLRKGRRRVDFTPKPEGKMVTPEEGTYIGRDHQLAAGSVAPRPRRKGWRMVLWILLPLLLLLAVV